MPTPSAAFFLFATYTRDGAKSPTSTTARLGATPVSARRRSTPTRTSPSTFWATALPSRINSRGYAQPTDIRGAAGIGIDDDDCSVKRSRSPGRLEADRHLGQEALEDDVLVDADHRIHGPRHAQIGDVRRAAGQDALVGRLHVTMS